MRIRFIALTLAVCGVCLFAIPQSPAPAEPQQAAAQIDFDALHAQAADALTVLQLSHERRMASVTGEDF
jgi:hypothetical protein